jgi:uncharacterized membrane protein YuzA (DUF378 family)
MIHYLIILTVGFASVFMLGFQSRNVNNGNYKMAATVSFIIAQSQTTLWGALFSNLTWSSSIVYGISGALGITSSMYVHQRWFQRPTNRETQKDLSK